MVIFRSRDLTVYPIVLGPKMGGRVAPETRLKDCMPSGRHSRCRAEIRGWYVWSDECPMVACGGKLVGWRDILHVISTGIVTGPCGQMQQSHDGDGDGDGDGNGEGVRL